MQGEEVRYTLERISQRIKDVISRMKTRKEGGGYEVTIIIWFIGGDNFVHQC